MFDWFKKFFEEKKSNNEVTVSFVLPSGKPLDVVALKSIIYPQTCSLHPNYIALKLPTNNCNGCWEYYSQKCKR
jgi:hypothetical protein